MRINLVVNLDADSVRELCNIDYRRLRRGQAIECKRYENDRKYAERYEASKRRNSPWRYPWSGRST